MLFLLAIKMFLITRAALTIFDIQIVSAATYMSYFVKSYFEMLQKKEQGIYFLNTLFYA